MTTQGEAPSADAGGPFLRPGPVPWPHPRRHVAPAKHGETAQESYDVVARIVTPEAEQYFRRIMKVTQSELEKLLVYKIQQMFDPVAPDVSAKLAQEELGQRIGLGGVNLQLPGAQNGSRPRELLREPLGSKDKAAEEGKHLTKSIVGVVGRILVDFSRFAETILRWQKDGDGVADVISGLQGATSLDGEVDVPGSEECGTDADDVEGEASLPAGPEKHADAALKAIIERVEQQERASTELEAKCCGLHADMRESKRQFMRERCVWRERLSSVKEILKRYGGDHAVAEAQSLDRDVQFFTPDPDDESVESVRDSYEARIAKMVAEHREIVAGLNAEILDLEEEVKMLRDGAERSDRRGLVRQQSTRAQVATPVVADNSEELERLRSGMAAEQAHVQSLQEESEELRRQLQELRLSPGRLAVVANGASEPANNLGVLADAEPAAPARQRGEVDMAADVTDVSVQQAAAGGVGACRAAVSREADPTPIMQEELQAKDAQIASLLRQLDARMAEKERLAAECDKLSAALLEAQRQEAASALMASNCPRKEKDTTTSCEDSAMRLANLTAPEEQASEDLRRAARAEARLQELESERDELLRRLALPKGVGKVSNQSQTVEDVVAASEVARLEAEVASLQDEMLRLQDQLREASERLRSTAAADNASMLTPPLPPAKAAVSTASKGIQVTLELPGLPPNTDQNRSVQQGPCYTISEFRYESPLDEEEYVALLTRARKKTRRTVSGRSLERKGTGIPIEAPTQIPVKEMGNGDLAGFLGLGGEGAAVQRAGVTRHHATPAPLIDSFNFDDASQEESLPAAPSESVPPSVQMAAEVPGQHEQQAAVGTAKGVATGTKNAKRHPAPTTRPASATAVSRPTSSLRRRPAGAPLQYGLSTQKLLEVTGLEKLGAPVVQDAVVRKDLPPRRVSSSPRAADAILVGDMKMLPTTEVLEGHRCYQSAVVNEAVDFASKIRTIVSEARSSAAQPGMSDCQEKQDLRCNFGGGWHKFGPLEALDDHRDGTADQLVDIAYAKAVLTEACGPTLVVPTGKSEAPVIAKCASAPEVRPFGRLESAGKARRQRGVPGRLRLAAPSGGKSGGSALQDYRRFSGAIAGHNGCADGGGRGPPRSRCGSASSSRSVVMDQPRPRSAAGVPLTASQPLRSSEAPCDVDAGQPVDKGGRAVSPEEMTRALLGVLRQARPTKAGGGLHPF
eukprot:TRINITY_DN10781_c0_g1_i4.p1 TRINITY_DN10781_c0_g1~~TRINITY_DN10781_c0_g1_i4.p1  ORF type:complete len:1251 (+),score=269.94 TRINITY_DN10781_c0_g1_i4:143-3754(+)